MRKPEVDYRQFRLSRLNDKRYAHLKLLGGWIVYFMLYFLTENFIPEARWHVIHCALDDVIPFREGFLVLYCYWYVLIVISLGAFLLYDVTSFKRLQVYIMITQAVAMLVYIVYPSVQYLRPASFERDNALTQLMAFIYAFDTPTGVCPSLHVAYSLGIASVWCKYKKAPALWKAFVILSVVMISISVAFVKQHSVVDIFAAIPVGLLAELLVYRASGALSRRFKARYLRAKATVQKGV